MDARLERAGLKTWLSEQPETIHPLLEQLLKSYSAQDLKNLARMPRQDRIEYIFSSTTSVATSFPELRFQRCGASSEQLSTLQTWWDTLTLAEQAAEVVHIASIPDAAVAVIIAAGYDPGPVNTPETPPVTFTFPTWTPNTYFVANSVVVYEGALYSALETFVSATTFDPTNWLALSSSSSSSSSGGQSGLTPTSTITEATYTAAANQLVVVDMSSAAIIAAEAFALTLPEAPADGDRVGFFVEQVDPTQEFQLLGVTTQGSDEVVSFQGTALSEASENALPTVLDASGAYWLELAVGTSTNVFTYHAAERLWRASELSLYETFVFLLSYMAVSGFTVDGVATFNGGVTFAESPQVPTPSPLDGSGNAASTEYVDTGSLPAGTSAAQQLVMVDLSDPDAETVWAAFPPGSAALAIGRVGDAFPMVVMMADAGDGWYWSDGSTDPTDGHGANLATAGVGGLVLTLQSLIIDASQTITLQGEIIGPADSFEISAVGIFNLKVDTPYAAGKGPVIHDTTNGHTYRIICTNGVLGTQQVT